MAKKTSEKDQAIKKQMTKIILPIKSPITGAYTFKEKIILSEKLEGTLATQAESL